MCDYDEGFPDNWTKLGNLVEIQLDAKPPAQPWLPGTFYGVGERVFNKTTGRYYTAISSGMSSYGTSEDFLPWPTMEGCSILDGTVVWVSEGFPYPTGNRALNPTHVFIPEWAPTPEPEVLEPLFEEREV